MPFTRGPSPAWAGKPRPARPLSTAIRVHPRVGGETSLEREPGRWGEGSIPRVGGETQRRPGVPDVVTGPSPRGRGNPTILRTFADTEGVHPRVGGETNAIYKMAQIMGGPSPRGRGNLRPCVTHRNKEGSIPAWAGKPAQARPGGGPTGGPSPRGRGNLAGFVRNHSVPRSIPAWAGKPDRTMRTVSLSGVHPRVGGETSGPVSVASRCWGPSPRGRGNHECHGRWRQDRWSIPAWAGKPLMTAAASAPKRVHPRCGRGKPMQAESIHEAQSGPSPRGRGNPR